VRKYVIAGLAVLAVALLGAFVWPGHVLGRGSSVPAAEASIYRAGRPVPAGATATARSLVSGTQAQQRAALSPALAAVLPRGMLFPAGSTLKLDAGTWHQVGDYANAAGTLSEPGASARPVEIGFIRAGSRWLVTFEEPLE
jgi:hypothetical protein